MFKSQNTIRLKERGRLHSPDSQKNSKISHNNSSTTQDEVAPIQKVRTLSQKKLTITSAFVNTLKKVQSPANDVNKFYRTPIRPNLNINAKKSVHEQNINKVSLKKLQNNQESFEKIKQNREREERQTQNKQKDKLETEEIIKHIASTFSKDLEFYSFRMVELQKRIKENNQKLLAREHLVAKLETELKRKQRIQLQLEEKISLLTLKLEEANLKVQNQQRSINEKIQKIDIYIASLMNQKVKQIKASVEVFLKSNETMIEGVSQKMEKVVKHLPKLTMNIESLEEEVLKLQQSTKGSISPNWQLFENFQSDDETQSTPSFSDDYFFYPKSLDYILSPRPNSHRKVDKISQLICILENNFSLPLDCQLNQQGELVNVTNGAIFHDESGTNFTVNESDLKFLMRQKYVRLLNR